MMTQHNNSMTDEMKRLRWCCRRGMWELDILLENFLLERYAALGKADQLLFQNLLECEDQELYMWLLGRASAIDPAFKSIVEMIRQHVSHRTRSS